MPQFAPPYSPPIQPSAMFKPAHMVKTKTGSRSGDLLGLSLELLSAQDADPDVANSLYSLGEAYLATRSRIRDITENTALTADAKRDLAREALSDAGELVRANRQKVTKIKNQAEATKFAAIQERQAILDERAKSDPGATELMTQVLMSLDPIKAGSKLRQAANNLGDSANETHPWLLVAARRAQKLGLEHPSHGTPLVSEEVATYIDDTLIHQSSLGSQYRP